MSGKIMGLVYDRVVPPAPRDVLLAVADHADHQGRNAYCSVGMIAWKLIVHPRTVQRNLRWLEKRAVLKVTGRTSYGCAVYSIHLSKLPRKERYRGAAKPDRKSVKGGKLPPPGKSPGGDGKMPPGGDIAVSPGGRHYCATQAVLEPLSSSKLLLAAAAAGGGLMTFRGADLKAEWEDALEGCTVAEVEAIFRDERLPNGKRIRMPSGFSAARERRAAARRDRVVAKREQAAAAAEALATTERSTAAARWVTARAQAAKAHAWWGKALEILEREAPDKSARDAIVSWLRLGAYPVSFAEDVNRIRLAVLSKIHAATITERFRKPLTVALAGVLGTAGGALPHIILEVQEKP